MATAMLTACDDGSIQERAYTSAEGKNVRLEGIIEGADNWNDSYSIAIAGFEESDVYATKAKVIIPSSENGNRASVALTAIPTNVTTVRLCVLNRLRQLVATFAEVDVTNASTRDTVDMNVGTVNVGMFQAVQNSYFNTTCAACHGSTGRAAAGLFLTDGKSYDAMVGQPSTKVEGAYIIEPGNAEASVLYQALTSELTSSWREYHRDLVSEYVELNILPIIKDWIDYGAKR